MSYILDALRRAEHDRRNAQSTPIEQVAITPQPQTAPASRRRGIVVTVIVLVLIAGLTVFAYGLWLHYRQAVAAPVAQLPVLIPAGEPAPQYAGKAQTSPAPKAVSAVPPPTTAHPNPIADAARLSSLKDLMPPKPAPPAVPRHHIKAAPKTAATVTAATGTPAAPLSTSSQSLAPPGATPAANTQALKAMPDSYRADFPQITVQVHVYDSNPAKCWVLIDGKRYKEGDTLPQGPKIYKIVPQGIVFDWQGQRVLYPVGS